MLNLSPDQFITLLQSKKVNRVHFTVSDHKWVASHEFLEPISNHFNNDSKDFDGHEGAFLGVGPRSGVLLSAFVHRSCRGPGAGGVRNWYYDSIEAFFREGLRLSKGMTLKNALAEIWWGGGKGVVARNSGKSLMNPMDKDVRKLIYLDYGEFMTSLHGCYVTAEDVGTTLDDMQVIFSKTRFTTCIPKSLGGSGIPAIPTALGVLVALEAAFDFMEKPLKGSTIVVQGVGHVGSLLVKHLFDKEVYKVIASDVDPSGIAHQIRENFKDYNFELVVVDKDDFSVLYNEADACCPCAIGGILNETTIPNIKAKIVVGAANNQLNNPQTDDKLLKNRGIMYLPDFLVNRMGIVNCADEHLGTLKNDSKFERHLGRKSDNSIYNLSLKIMRESLETDQTTHEIATKIAEERSFDINPLYGHRGLEIIQSISQDEEY